jgi:hypothetical protein
MISDFTIIQKEYEYEEGKNYNESYFEIIIESTQKVYLKNMNHLLFSFHKNVIDNERYFPLLEKNYNGRILTSCNRKTATGSNCEQSRTPTGILGYIDCLTPQQKTLLFGINNGARKTKFLKEKNKEWIETLSLYEKVDEIFKQATPKHYKQQKKEYNKIHSQLKIPKTNFTTITVNRNFRTATHTDKGDLKNGLSCIICIGNNKYKGGFLGFPKQKVLVKMRPGDVIFMDSHQPHCNTKLNTDKSGVRFSLVCYVREKMKDFTHPVVVENQTFFLTEKDFQRFSESKKLI